MWIPVHAERVENVVATTLCYERLPGDPGLAAHQETIPNPSLKQNGGDDWGKGDEMNRLGSRGENQLFSLS